MDKSFMLTLCQVKSVERIGFFVSRKHSVGIASQSNAVGDGVPDIPISTVGGMTLTHCAWQAPIYYLCFNKTISRHPLEPRGLLLCSGGGKVSKTPLFLGREKRVLLS